MSWATTCCIGRAHPDGLQCTNRNMADWDGARNKIEAEANTFASYLLMPLDDFRAQIKGRAIDIDVMTELADRYAVSLTAAILKWMTITDKRAMIVVGKEGFIDWAWSSEPLIRSGHLLRSAADRDRASPTVTGSAGVRMRHRPPRAASCSRGLAGERVRVRNDRVLAQQRDDDLAAALSRPRPTPQEMAELEEEPIPDTFDKFMDGDAR